MTIAMTVGAGFDLVYALVFSAILFGIIAIRNLAVNGGPDNVQPIRKGLTGLWGPISSSVDWCEENYIYSGYVAEMHNTVSSGVITLVGISGLYSTLKCASETRYILIALLLICIGLGSVAFHGALRHWMQALDEVPMLWLAITSVFCALEHEAMFRGSKPYGVWLPRLLVFWALIASSCAVFFHGGLQVVCFYISFVSAKLFSLYGLYRIMQDTADEETRSMCRCCFAFLALSVFCWSLDSLSCSRLQNLPYGLPNPQLHAWGWHLGVAIAVYGMLLVAMKEKLQMIGTCTDYVWLLKVWPVLLPSQSTRNIPHQHCRSPYFKIH